MDFILGILVGYILCQILHAAVWKKFVYKDVKIRRSRAKELTEQGISCLKKGEK